MEKRIGIFIGFSILAIFIAPLIFTSGAICERFEFLQTGPIGDTIGGCTAPIVGIVSVVLLYLTLKSQLDFNKTQTNLQRDEQFKSTLFYLLGQQRDILLSLHEDFEFLKRGNFDKTKYSVSGQAYFTHALFQLQKLFHVLEKSTAYSNSITEEEKNGILEDLSYRIYDGINLPSDMKEENKNNIENTHNLLWLNFLVNKFSISEEEFNDYKKNEDACDKIKFVYRKFFAVYFRNGYYFRHLYRLLKFIDNTALEEIKRNPAEKASIQRKYGEYAQFVQAQMSFDEMLLVFYNCSLFVKTKHLIVKYNILENLYLENLILPNHTPFGEELHLSHHP